MKLTQAHHLRWRETTFHRQSRHFTALHLQFPSPSSICSMILWKQWIIFLLYKYILIDRTIHLASWCSYVLCKLSMPSTFQLAILGSSISYTSWLLLFCAPYCWHIFQTFRTSRLGRIPQNSMFGSKTASQFSNNCCSARIVSAFGLSNAPSSLCMVPLFLVEIGLLAITIFAIFTKPVKICGFLFGLTWLQIAITPPVSISCPWFL